MIILPVSCSGASGYSPRSLVVCYSHRDSRGSDPLAVTVGSLWTVYEAYMRATGTSFQNSINTYLNNIHNLACQILA